METGVEISVLCVFLWLLWSVSCGSCGGFLWFLWWWFLGGSCCDWSYGCNVLWVLVVLDNGFDRVEIGVVGFGWG